jgi:hypothetical protein
LIVLFHIQLALQHHERRQIVVHAAQPIGKPRSQARLAGIHIAGIHEHDRWLVVDGFRIHGLDNCEIVDDLRRIWQQIATGAGLSVSRMPV